MSTDIASVTRTLKTLIATELEFQGENIDDIAVTAAPPDTAEGSRHTVSVYLFHVLESPEYKNLRPSVGSGPAPVRHAPMGLILQYIITVAGPVEESPDLDVNSLTQQRLIGLIARAVHDYPLITERTQIQLPSSTEPTSLLDVELRGSHCRLRFSLRPAPMEESINFWSAEEKNVPRLSLFVEARVAIMEPKPPVVAPGVTLSIGQFVFAGSEPQLLATRSEQSFVPPGGSRAQTVQASPARVAIFDAPGSANLIELEATNARLGDNNRLRLDVTSLGAGRRILALRHRSGEIRIALDQLPVEIPVVNMPWEFSAQENEISMRVWQQVQDVDDEVRDIMAGTYGVRILVFDDRVGGAPRPRASNELTLSVVPQILSAGPTEPPQSNHYTLELVTAALRASSEVTLSVGGHPLTLVTTPPAAGEFRIPFAGVDPVPPLATLEFSLPWVDPGAPSPVAIQPSTDSPLAVRLMVDGAAATPAWLTVGAP